MGKRKRRGDPMADYIEWIDNRYNPGHYLGGNVPPYLRKSSLGPNARRLAGLALALTALMGLASLVPWFSFTDGWSRVEFAVGLGVFALLAWAAVVMFRRPRPSPTPERDNATRHR